MTAAWCPRLAARWSAEAPSGARASSFAPRARRSETISASPAAAASSSAASPSRAPSASAISTAPRPSGIARATASPRAPQPQARPIARSDAPARAHGGHEAREAQVSPRGGLDRERGDERRREEREAVAPGAQRRQEDAAGDRLHQRRERRVEAGIDAPARRRDDVRDRPERAAEIADVEVAPRVLVGRGAQHARIPDRRAAFDRDPPPAELDRARALGELRAVVRVRGPWRRVRVRVRVCVVRGPWRRVRVCVCIGRDPLHVVRARVCIGGGPLRVLRACVARRPRRVGGERRLGRERRRREALRRRWAEPDVHWHFPRGERREHVLGDDAVARPDLSRRIGDRTERAGRDHRHVARARPLRVADLVDDLLRRGVPGRADRRLPAREGRLEHAYRLELELRVVGEVEPRSVVLERRQRRLVRLREHEPANVLLLEPGRDATRLEQRGRLRIGQPSEIDDPAPRRVADPADVEARDLAFGELVDEAARAELGRLDVRHREGVGVPERAGDRRGQGDPRRDRDRREPTEARSLGEAGDSRELAQHERDAQRHAQGEEQRGERLVAPAVPRRREQERVEGRVEERPREEELRRVLGRGALDELLAGPVGEPQRAVRCERDEHPDDAEAGVERVAAETRPPRVEVVERAIAPRQAARHLEPEPASPRERARRRVTGLHDVGADVDGDACDPGTGDRHEVAPALAQQRVRREQAAERRRLGAKERERAGGDSGHDRAPAARARVSGVTCAHARRRPDRRQRQRDERHRLHARAREPQHVRRDRREERRGERRPIPRRGRDALGSRAPHDRVEQLAGREGREPVERERPAARLEQPELEVDGEQRRPEVAGRGGAVLPGRVAERARLRERARDHLVDPRVVEREPGAWREPRDRRDLHRGERGSREEVPALADECQAA